MLKVWRRQSHWPPLDPSSLGGLAVQLQKGERQRQRIMRIGVKKAFVDGTTQMFARSVLQKMKWQTKVVWQSDFAKTMHEAGFKPPLASTCVYFNAVTGVRLVAYMSDVLCVGREQG